MMIVVTLLTFTETNTIVLNISLIILKAKYPCKIKVKHLREKGLNNCISPSHQPCATFLLGHVKSTKGVVK